MKIVAFYDVPEDARENRVYSPASATVVDYLCECLTSMGKTVEIVSAAETRNTAGYWPESRQKLRDGIFLIKAPTKGTTFSLLRSIFKIWSRLWLVKYLLVNIQKGETLLFYDSPVLYEPLLLFRFFAFSYDIKILYFASEIYQKVIPLPFLKRKMEWYLFHHADKYIVSTEMLNRIINPKCKPYVLLHGTYSVAEVYNDCFGDSRIHLVYAGWINANKGAMKAVQMAQYLDARYCIHILGFGTKMDIDRLHDAIRVIRELSSCEVVYEGSYSGSQFQRFLQKCVVGLCTQDADAEYNDSSFPSKVLTYLANGLRVVSVDLETIRTSAVGDLVIYAKSDAAEDFAKAVQSIDFRVSYDSRTRIREIHREFCSSLEKIVE